MQVTWLSTLTVVKLQDVRKSSPKSAAQRRQSPSRALSPTHTVEAYTSVIAAELDHVLNMMAEDDMFPLVVSMHNTVWVQMEKLEPKHAKTPYHQT